ncbi:MAG TPA: acyl-CoA thioesterase [Xenococcaceae cyanobacterium]|jgi:1,4-dihydroxy-2-naphthoyl-CoA hydrolase
MAFSYQRTVYLADTDAAGVVYFARVMEMCHEAYETWLATIGFDLAKLLSEKKLALPIVHADIDFFRPLFCGDKLQITLQFTAVNQTEFAIAYEIFQLNSSEPKTVVKATTNHVCINPLTRTRVLLPLAISQSLLN